MQVGRFLQPWLVCHALIVSPFVFLSPDTAHSEVWGSWSDRSPLLTPRQEVGVGVLDGWMYVVGGIDATPAVSDVVERYHPGSDVWESVAPLPAALDHVAVVGAGNRLYAIGGLSFASPASATDSVFSYDPELNEWSQEESMPNRRGGGRAAVIEGKIYMVGGIRSGGSVGDFASFDLSTGEWTPLPNMPTSRDHLAVAALGGRVYAISGRNPSLRPEVEIYDTTSGEWTEGASIPTPRAGIAAAVLLNRIFVFGGEGSNRPNGIFDEVEVYNPETDRWRSLPPMPLGRHGIGAGVLGGSIYIPGGGPVIGLSRTDHHDAFTPRSIGSSWTLK